MVHARTSTELPVAQSVIDVAAGWNHHDLILGTDGIAALSYRDVQLAPPSRQTHQS